MARSPVRKRQRVESSSVELEELPVPKRHKHDVAAKTTTVDGVNGEAAGLDETIEISDSDADAEVLEPELELAATHERAVVAQDSNEGPEAEETASEADRYRVWDNFREEYHDIVQELPLELVRILQLTFEHDQQAKATEAVLATSLAEYMSIVKTGQHRTCLSNQAQRKRKAANALEAKSAAALQTTPATGSQANRATGGEGHNASLSSTSSVDADNSNEGVKEEDALVERVRTILADITKHTRAVIAVSELKVASALTAHDWLERYIHRLDSDLERHEAALSLGLRPGTLPSKDAQIAQMQALEDAVQQNGRQPGMTAAGGKADDNTSTVAHQLSTAKSKSKGGPKGRKEKTPAERSKWIYIPPDAPAWRENNRYCYCHQPSYGSMIACDYALCEREWFHYYCLGIKVAPRGSWWCKDCAKQLNLKKFM